MVLAASLMVIVMASEAEEARLANPAEEAVMLAVAKPDVAPEIKLTAVTPEDPETASEIVKLP
jgi:hypothetical protein